MRELIKKFKFRGTGIVLHAPKNLEGQFVELGFKSSATLEDRSSNTLVFVMSKMEFIGFLTDELENVERDSVLWFAYPKISSGIRTDINRDSLRTTANEFGLSTVSAISIDEIWSALRCRPADKVGNR